jgi:uncharacterized protein YutE (UPF0331/DUF86 family)
MMPRRFDAAVIEEKLVLMRELLDDLEAVGDVSPQRFEAEHLTRHGVERMLTQLVELAAGINAHIAAPRLGRVSANYRASFLLAAQAGAITSDLAETLAPSAGFRNVLVDQYGEIDPVKVAKTTPQALVNYREYVRQVARWLQSLGPASS